MTIIQQPGANEIAMNMTDFIIDTDSSILFEVHHGEVPILSEKYVPDALNQVRTHKLGRFLANALWGQWPTSVVFNQDHLSGIFYFYVDGVQQCTSTVLYSNRYLKLAASPVFLTHGNTKITRPGMTEYLTVHAPGELVKVEAEDSNGDVVASLISYAGEVTTYDVSYNRVASLLGFNPVGSYKVYAGDSAFTYVVDHNHYVELFQFRYHNVFDAPEVLSCVGEFKAKGAEKASTGFLYGVERKFDVRANDEYSVNSGVIFLGSEYKYWHDFLNTREAEILIDGTWYSILISKQNYEREFRKDRLKSVEFSFRFADPDQNGLL